MPVPDRYIPGVPCWVDTSQPDPDRAAAFYRDLFGWECENTMPEDAPGSYLTGRIRGEDVAAIGSVPDGAAATAVWNTYIWVDSVDDAVARSVDAGGSVVVEPVDIFDAGRTATVADPEGAVFSVWEAQRHRGAGVVNEPGSVNFNDLHTRDLDRAATFYGHVFGWEVLDLAGGAMWALAPYGDHLEALNPGMRQQMAGMGAPDGFENVVASIVAIGDDEPGVPAHWGVTFAVEDADRAAKHAVELGGRVTVEPMDAPWVRMAVIEDPQGATFVVSQFVPENRELAV